MCKRSLTTQRIIYLISLSRQKKYRQSYRSLEYLISLSLISRKKKWLDFFSISQIYLSKLFTFMVTCSRYVGMRKTSKIIQLKISNWKYATNIMHWLWNFIGITKRKKYVLCFINISFHYSFYSFVSRLFLRTFHKFMNQSEYFAYIFSWVFLHLTQQRKYWHTKMVRLSVSFKADCIVGSETNTHEIWQNVYRFAL